MAKKKPGDKRKSGKSQRSKRESLPPIPDRRVMEGIMQQMLQGMGLGGGRQTPLDRAQELMYSAFETEGPERVALAKQALELSADCADAYVALAEEANTLEEALDLYRKGVAAGERALGKKAFKQYRGQFWGFMETRPYMRARLGLAQALWDAGQRDEAVGHFEELLRLNLNDNQGVRYLLANALLELNRDDDLERLLEEYEDDASADWVYSRALLAFRKEGDSPRAGQLLQKAQRANAHVPDYLSGRKPMPAEMPAYVGRGDEDEAIVYTSAFRSAWRATPGALAWMRKVLKLPLGMEPEPRRLSWRQVKTRLMRLPQIEDEVWQVDARQSGMSYAAETGEFRPWMLLVTNPTEDSVLEFEVGESRPTANDVWEYLVGAMIDPRDKDPHRPGRIEVRLKTLHKSWQAKLEQVDIQCDLCDELEHVEQILERMPVQTGMESAPVVAEPEELAALPLEVGETWQADARHLPTWIDQDGDPQRPWTSLVANRDQELLLANELTTESPTAEWLWQSIVRAIQQPAVGNAHRPSAIEVRRKYADALRGRLASIGVECVERDELELVERIFADLGRHMAGSDLVAGLLEVPGMTEAQVGSFVTAAAEFYRRAPWRDIAWDHAIKIECDAVQSGPWYALVMGQSGMVLGLALYEDLEILHATINSSGDEDTFRRTSAISLLFGEAFEMPFADLDAIEEHHWPVAAPEAYPHAQRVNPGYAIRPLLPWELRLLEAAMRTIPDFATGRSPEQAVTVPTGAGPLSLRLSWLRM